MRITFASLLVDYRYLLRMLLKSRFGVIVLLLSLLSQLTDIQSTVQNIQEDKADMLVSFNLINSISQSLISQLMQLDK